MDRASSLIYPGSKTLAGWWRQLQPRLPHAIHVGYAFVHRIEATAQTLRDQPIDSLTHLLLQAILLQQRDHASIELDCLQQILRLPTAVLQHYLANLSNQGLLNYSAPTGWQVADVGRAALEQGRYPVRATERLTFAFAERLNPTGQRTHPPFFLPLEECAGVPWPVDEPHRFDAAYLRDCVQQLPAWKQQWAFPGAMEALTSDASPADWQQVLIDRPERILFVLARLGQADAAEWMAFSAKADGWHLNDQSPILRVPALADRIEVGFAEPPAPAVFHEAWRAWCRERNLPANEVELCVVTYQPPRLEVRAPERLVQRLRAAKSDLFKGEAWLLVGDGYQRTAALLSIA